MQQSERAPYQKERSDALPDPDAPDIDIIDEEEVPRTATRLRVVGIPRLEVETQSAESASSPAPGVPLAKESALPEVSAKGGGGGNGKGGDPFDPDELRRHRKTLIKIQQEEESSRQELRYLSGGWGFLNPAKKLWNRRRIQELEQNMRNLDTRRRELLLDHPGLQELLPNNILPFVRRAESSTLPPSAPQPLVQESRLSALAQAQKNFERQREIIEILTRTNADSDILKREQEILSSNAQQLARMTVADFKQQGKIKVPATIPSAAVAPLPHLDFNIESEGKLIPFRKPLPFDEARDIVDRVRPDAIRQNGVPKDVLNRYAQTRRQIQEAKALNQKDRLKDRERMLAWLEGKYPALRRMREEEERKRSVDTNARYDYSWRVKQAEQDRIHSLKARERNARGEA